MRRNESSPPKFLTTTAIGRTLWWDVAAEPGLRQHQNGAGMSANIENGGGGSASGRLAELTQAVSSGEATGTLLNNVPRKRVVAVTRMVEETIQVAETASDDTTELSVEDQLVLAILEHRAMHSSQQPLRSGRKSPHRRSRPLGLDREEVQRASAGAPMYPHVVLDGDELDGNALSLIGAVTSALREAGIPDEGVDAVFEKAIPGDYSHVLKTVTGLVTIRWRSDTDVEKRGRGRKRRGSGTGAPRPHAIAVAGPSV